MIGRLLRSAWLRALLTVAILAYLASRIDIRLALSSMLRLDPRAAGVVLALLAIDRVIMVWRWLILLRASHVRVSVWSAGRIFFVSSFVGSFLPAGIGADALRAFGLTRAAASAEESVASVTVDRLLGLLSIVLLGAFGVVMWTRQPDAGLRESTLLVALLVTAGTAAAFWADWVLRAAMPRRWHVSRQGRRLLGLVDALGRYRDRRATLAVVLLLSLSVQVLRVVQAYVLGRGLGLDVSLAYYLVFMPIGLLMLLLPISVSGFGLPQGVIVWLLRPQGVPDAASFALSTLIILTALVANLPGAWFYLWPRKP